MRACRLRVAEFCKDFDKRRCGYITVPQFHRALDMCKLELTGGDIELLVAKHSHSDAFGRVNYKSFAEAIDSGTKFDSTTGLFSLRWRHGHGARACVLASYMRAS